MNKISIRQDYVALLSLLQKLIYAPAVNECQLTVIYHLAVRTLREIMKAINNHSFLAKTNNRETGIAEIKDVNDSSS